MMIFKYLYLVKCLLAIICGTIIISLSVSINQRRRMKHYSQLGSMHYTLFAGIFSLLTAIFEIVKKNVQFLDSKIIIILVNDILNLIFTFVSCVILSYMTGYHSCSNKEYVQSTGIYTSSITMCREFQALGFISLILFFLYIISSIISGFLFGKDKGANARNRGYGAS